MTAKTYFAAGAVAATAATAGTTVICLVFLFAIRNGIKSVLAFFGPFFFVISDLPTRLTAIEKVRPVGEGVRYFVDH